jgi:hypothetical protein
VDLTGYWVSLVTADWRFRMMTPLKGDYESLPLTAEARKIADSWDPTKPAAPGEECKPYGAAALMRMPGRLHITWANDTTLRIDTDNGSQTRLLHFGGQPPPGGEAQWQGYSIARWEVPSGSGGVALGAPRAPARQLTGSLEVVTTHMRPGYLRKNGVPYSGNAVLTEYFSRADEANGDSWLALESIVEDPQYLDQPFITSTPFKKQADSSGWHPTNCEDR